MCFWVVWFALVITHWFPVQFGACVLSSSVITRAKEVCSSRVLSPVFIFWFLGSDESSFLLFYQY